MAGSMSYRGVDLGSYGVVCVGGGERWAGSGFELREYEAGNGGVIVDGARRAGLTLAVPCCVGPASTRTALLGDLEHIAEALNPWGGPGWLGFDARPGRYWWASLAAPVGYRHLGLLGAEFEAEFRLLRGYAEGAAETETIAVSGSPAVVHVPADSGETIEGTMNCKAAWELTAGAGGLSDVRVTNDTTGETIRWHGSLTEGERVVIDGVNETVETFEAGSETGVNAMSGIWDFYPFPGLEAGTRNQVTVTGGDGASLLVRWRAAYV